MAPFQLYLHSSAWTYLQLELTASQVLTNIAKSGIAKRIQLNILRDSIHIASLCFVWLLQHYPSLLMERVSLALHLLHRKHACMG